METNEKIKAFAERLEKIKATISTEEATKTSMVMPFFQLLGYDVFNPLEFVPEYTADVGVKKKEKVDYAIMIDGKPLIFIECKPCSEDLGKHYSQLVRYFACTPEARFGILTNGIVYKFFTDLDKPNVMDETPFLTIDLLNLKDRDLNELRKFAKDTLDVDNILNSAEDLKYTKMIKDWLDNEMANPSAAFVKLVISDMYEGIKNQKVIDHFTVLVKRAMAQYVNDTVNAKIQNALLPHHDEEPTEAEQKEKKIVTTIEEIEAYSIVKSILRQTVDSSRITYRDAETYCGIFLDDNNRKWICRLHLSGKKYIVVSDEDKNGVRHDISHIDEIYNHADEIIASCKKYL